MKKPLKILIALFVVLVALGAAAKLGYITLPNVPGYPAEPKKVGILQYVASLDQVAEGFKLGMEELGYVEGKDVVYEYQSSNGDVNKAKEISADYIAKNVDVIYTMSTSATKAALDATKEAQSTIPIVYGQANVSIKIGNIASYQSSGNNVTGVENVNSDYIEKEIDFLMRIKHSTKKIGIFALVPPFQQLVTKDSIETVERLAPKFNLQVVRYDVKVPPGPAAKEAIQKMVDAMQPGEVDAIIHLSDPATNFQDTPNIFIKAQERLKAPLFAIVVPHVQQGALLSYGSDFKEQGKQSAAVVNKVLKGVKPADIPVEFANKTVLALNLKTAKALGLTIPDSILSIANVKIEK